MLNNNSIIIIIIDLIPLLSIYLLGNLHPTQTVDGISLSGEGDSSYPPRSRPCSRNLHTTGWGKIPSLLSVGHCEGRGRHRRVGLGLKGAGSWEVPVTTLYSRKDGVVQRAACICCRNLLFAKSLYRSSAACVPYSLPNPPSGPSTGPKIHSVVG